MLRQDVDQLKADFKVLRQAVDQLKADFKVLRQAVDQLKADFKVLRQDVDQLKADVKVLRQDVNALQKNVAEARVSIRSLEEKVDEKTTFLSGKIDHYISFVGHEIFRVRTRAEEQYYLYVADRQKNELRFQAIEERLGRLEAGQSMATA